MKRLLTALATGIILVTGSHARAQDPGGLGTLECRAIQRDVQAGVASGGPYENHGQLLRTATRQVDAAQEAREITKECAECIIRQFAQSVPIAQQEPCGPDPICGDNLCSVSETLYSCPADCGGSAVIGDSTQFISLADLCAQPGQRACESLTGDVTTDAMRTTYVVDFAIVNAGVLHDDLTCPLTDDPTDFCPSYAPPPFPITRGQVLDALPLRDAVVTLSVNGAELKTMLEHGVSAAPTGSSQFSEVSGLCFTYDIEAPAGSRVTAAVRQSADGECVGAPIDLTAGAVYTIAENSFMVSGGDGYPDFSSRAELRDVTDQVVANYIGANSPISPGVQGRIKCMDNLGGSCAWCGGYLCPSPNYCASCGLAGFLCLRPDEGCTQ